VATPQAANFTEDGAAKPSYEGNEAFNDFWDESFGEFTMGDYAYTASEILFALDKQAYAAECQTYGDLDADEP
jgi:hypothetical protein